MGKTKSVARGVALQPKMSAVAWSAAPPHTPDHDMYLHVHVGSGLFQSVSHTYTYITCTYSIMYMLLNLLCIV